MRGRKRKLNYEEIYKDILLAEKNKELYRQRERVLKSRKYYPRTYRDVAKKYKISPEQVSLIKKSMQNEAQNM